LLTIPLPVTKSTHHLDFEVSTRECIRHIKGRLANECIPSAKKPVKLQRPIALPTTTEMRRNL
jgi:hypothetical protein